MVKIVLTNLFYLLAIIIGSHGAGPEQQLSSLGLEPSYPVGNIDLQSQPSFSNLLAHANSMTFSYSSLNGPRRGTSNFLSRTLSSQSSQGGLGSLEGGAVPALTSGLSNGGLGLGLSSGGLNWAPSGVGSEYVSAANGENGGGGTQPMQGNESMTQQTHAMGSQVEQAAAPPPLTHASTMMICQEYEAPMPGPSNFGANAQSYSALVASEARQCPSEFLLEGSRMSVSTLEAINKASVTLQTLRDLENSCPPALDKLRRTQAQAIQSGDSSLAKQVDAEQSSMGSQLEQAIQEMFLIIRAIVLDSFTLLAARQLVQQLQLHQHVLEMFKQELHHTFGPQLSSQPLSPNQVPPVVSLYVTEQPLPQVVFKEKPIEERYVVAVLTASQQDIAVDKHMSAILNFGDVQVKAGTATLANHIVPVDSTLNERRSCFETLAVNISTRMAPISLKFQTIVSKGSFQSPVATVPTYPFIVITNESQWFEAAGKLLVLDTFTSGKNVFWPQFANTLHSHYLKATRQSEAERPIYHFEFDYIHQRFFDLSDQVSEKQVNVFWNWFGQCLQTIRFKRYIANMWNTGIIFGFMTKEECNRVLQGQGLGTFLIRFSESLPGLFGVAYVSDDPKERIKHCLIKNEDIGSNKSLAEFLRDKDQFQLLLRMDVQEIGKIRRMPKDLALVPYYSKKKVTTNTSNPGYIVL